MILATRGGDLGRAQAREASDALATRFAEEVDVHAITTEELDLAVYTGKADVAIHRLDRLPLVLHTDLTIGAVLPRGAFTDALVSRFSLTDLPRGARVATSNARRKAILLRARPDLTVVDAFGEVSDRVRRWRVGEVDAIATSTASLRHADLEVSHETLDAKVFVPSPGQGALACVCKGGSRFEEFLAGIDDARTRAEVEIERAVLAGLGGNARLPIGAHAVHRGTEIVVRAVVLSPDGRRAVSIVETISVADPLYGADELAEKLKRSGGDVLLAEARKALK